MKLSPDILKVLTRDKALAPVLKLPYQRPSPSSRGLFGDLIRAIIGQQVSTSAARTIYGRLANRFENDLITADGLLEMSEDELRACGLSRQKTQYLGNIATHFMEGGLNDEDYRLMDDDAIIKDLTSIKGVGVWTVQMILLSTFQRPDVFPSGDLGIQNAMKAIYGLDLKGRELIKAIEAIAENWRPFRSYASLYLWNTLH